MFKLMKAFSSIVLAYCCQSALAFSPTFASTTTRTSTTTTSITSATTCSSSSSKTTTSSSTSVALYMAKGGRLECRPIGVGSAAPATRVTNADLENVVETTDEWIKSRTGIGSRHILKPTESLRDLQIQAARNALAMANVDAQDLDLVICATSSNEDLFGDAPSVASALGCTKDTVAFDLTAACSGFLFASVTAGQFLNNGMHQKALVLGADALSRWVDWDDRNTCILFGDGAGAMVLEATEVKDGDAGVLGYAVHSNGGGYEELTLGYEPKARKVSTPGEGTSVSDGKYGKIGMNGKEVYKFATREVPRVIKEALEVAELTVDDIDHVLLHQANIRIMETVASRLKVSMDKVIANLDEYGNTSAASIPLALDEAVRSGRVKPGDVIACAGFGAGLSWGAAIFKWGGEAVVVDSEE